MFKSIQDILTRWDKLAGVDMTLLQEGFLLCVCVLERKKGVITLSKKQTDIRSLEELKTFLGEEIPIALSLSGKGILHKKIEHSTEKDRSKLLQQAIPNAKPGDFYLQTVRTAQHQFLSIVRKGTSDETAQLFAGQALPLISISLGGMALVSLLAFLPDLSQLNAGEHQLEIQSGELLRYQAGTKHEPQNTLHIGEETVAAPLAVAYASAFQQFLPEQVEAEIPPIQEQKEEFVQKGLFTKMGWGMLVFFLLVLLGNFAAFSYLSQETDKLSVASTLQKSQLEELTLLKKEVGEKEKFFLNEGWTKNSQASFFADRIAETIPESILLTTLVVIPLDEEASREKRKQLFKDELIEMTGTCKRPIDLNGWIKRLKDFSWAKKVDVEQYTYDSAEKRGHFRVEIRF
jgi:hypothetical protein